MLRNLGSSFSSVLSLFSREKKDNETTPKREVVPQGDDEYHPSDAVMLLVYLGEVAAWWEDALVRRGYTGSRDLCTMLFWLYLTNRNVLHDLWRQVLLDVDPPFVYPTISDKRYPNPWCTLREFGVIKDDKTRYWRTKWMTGRRHGSKYRFRLVNRRSGKTRPRSLNSRTSLRGATDRAEEERKEFLELMDKRHTMVGNPLNLAYDADSDEEDNNNGSKRVKNNKRGKKRGKTVVIDLDKVDLGRQKRGSHRETRMAVLLRHMTAERQAPLGSGALRLGSPLADGTYEEDKKEFSPSRSAEDTQLWEPGAARLPAPVLVSRFEAVAPASALVPPVLVDHFEAVSPEFAQQALELSAGPGN